jgi:hypothetical protein
MGEKALLPDRWRAWDFLDAFVAMKPREWNAHAIVARQRRISLSIGPSRPMSAVLSLLLPVARI